MNYEADVRRASRLMPPVKEGFAANLTEATTRFAISHRAMGTILVGMATPQQFEAALAAVIGPAAACRARAAGCAPGGIRRRTKVIAEIADNLGEVSDKALRVTARGPQEPCMA